MSDRTPGELADALENAHLYRVVDHRLAKEIVCCLREMEGTRIKGWIIGSSAVGDKEQYVEHEFTNAPPYDVESGDWMTAILILTDPREKKT